MLLSQFTFTGYRYAKPFYHCTSSPSLYATKIRHASEQARGRPESIYALRVRGWVKPKAYSR